MRAKQTVPDLFELVFTDGFATQWHTRTHGDFEQEYDWAALRPESYAPKLVERARLAWTHQALNEYGTAVAMSQLVATLARSRAPLDLITMAAGFVSEELSHAELYARLATRMGGGAPVGFEARALGVQVDQDLSSEQQAHDLVVRLCCVGEAFSCSLLAASMECTRHPLVRSILERVVREEALHARLGWLYLDWVADELTAADRERMGRVACETLDALATQWGSSRIAPGIPVEQLEDLGWLQPGAYRVRALTAVQESVLRPLERYQITAAWSPPEGLPEQ